MAVVLCDQVFKIPDERMRVLTYDVGGAFGSKEQPYPEDVALLYAAKSSATAGEVARFAVRKIFSLTTMPATL